MNMLQLLTKIKPCSRPTCTCVPRLQKYAIKLPISQIEEEILGRKVEKLRFEYMNCYNSKTYKDWQSDFNRIINKYHGNK
jgi:hypothetical protein